MTEHQAPGLLDGLRVIEFSSFVAGPLGGMTLAQLGADVIRVDPINGAPDAHRWPLSAKSNRSLFWDGLNKGKRSVAIDVRSPAGQELLVGLAAAPGPQGGILIENQPGRSWLAPEALRQVRSDCIHVHIEGHADGRPAVDYTINPEMGVPWMTGPENSAGPVNHVLPAWDLLTGATASIGLLAALRHRDLTGEGRYIAISLADVALAGLASMGWLTEAEERGGRDRTGNYLYGAYGIDFATRDGERVMVVALTGRQWKVLVQATGTAAVFAALETALDINLADEGVRYLHRETLTAVLKPWFAARDMEEVERALNGVGALWSRYRHPSEVVTDFRAGTSSGVLAEVDQPGTGPVISSRSPLRLDAGYGPTASAPHRGEHTEQVLSEVLGLTAREIGKLRNDGVIGT